MDYQEIRNDPLRDCNDCTVVTTAVVTGISYADAHRKLAAAGRKPNSRTNSKVYHPVITGLGFTIESITKTIASKTVRTIERELAANWGGVKAMVRTRGHILAWNGECIVDWTAGRLQRIIAVHIVYPTDTVPVGRSVPEPKQKALNRVGHKRSAVIASCEALGHDEKQYSSVKAAYEAMGLNLRGHQKVRLYVKHHGSVNYKALALSSYDGDQWPVSVQMRLVE